MSKKFKSSGQFSLKHKKVTQSFNSAFWISIEVGKTKNHIFVIGFSDL